MFPLTLLLMCMSALIAYTAVHHVCAVDSEAQRSGVTENCELPCKCWEPSLGPPQQLQVLTAESPLQPAVFHLEQGRNPSSLGFTGRAQAD